VAQFTPGALKRSTRGKSEKKKAGTGEDRGWFDSGSVYFENDNQESGMEGLSW